MDLPRRRLGRTGLMVTALGLGAMDTSQSPEGAATLRAALEAGINFIDTAREYAGSEFLIGQLVRELREPGGAGLDVPAHDFPAHVGSKTFSHTLDGSQRDVDRSLSVLGLEQITLYQLHDISTPAAYEEAMGANGALEGLQVARYRELIRSIGVSSHNLEVAEQLIRSGEFDTIMLEYSAFYPDSRPLIELAHGLDVGVIVMRPVGGSGRTSVMRGRLAAGDAGVLTPANLLRYVLAQPGVSVAIPGASYPSRIAENVATVARDEPMSESEQRALEDAAARLY
ncbi:MAG: aldo/keto reductase [Dehalococcoidia bacterium]|nr:aldo/keto reductase [Dehalococcoidia bacterium]